MAASRLPLVLLLVLWCISNAALACVFKYGTSPDSLVPPHGGTHWNHALAGDDWAGEDATGKPWICKTGSHQSPINLPSRSVLLDPGHQIPPQLRTSWSYPDLISNGSDIEVINNGHAIQVEWLSPYKGHIKIAVPEDVTNNTKITSVLTMDPKARFHTVTAVPVQFHFHTSSEHLFAGRYFPLEMHIVHKLTTGLPACANGCFSVTGIVFELCVDCEDNPLLKAIWAYMPTREGAINYLPPFATINLDELLGAPEDRTYMTYEGSLTTPPCSEGLLWHVMLKPQKISVKQWRAYKKAVSFKTCAAVNSTASPAPAPHEHHHHHRHLYRRLRMLLAGEEEPIGSPNDYNCTFFAYGTNFRAPQPSHGRIVKLAPAPGGQQLASSNLVWYPLRRP